MNKYTDEIIEGIIQELPKTDKDWELLGFINERKDIYTFGHDSKIIGRLFEIIVEPVLQKVADNLGLKLVFSTSQTVYPDFYFENDQGRRFAVDIKSTYRRTRNSFTQGSFTSYLRDNTKNIDGNYSLYDKHYMIMFIYDREGKPSDGVFTLDDLPEITAAYKNVDVAVMEKYRVGGDKPGSGNTDNIGTFKAKQFEAFSYGAGPFAFLGNDCYVDYWRNYPRNTLPKKERELLYNNLNEYFSWLENNGKKELATEYRKKYKEYLEFNKSKKWDII